MYSHDILGSGHTNWQKLYNQLSDIRKSEFEATGKHDIGSFVARFMNMMIEDKYARDGVVFVAADEIDGNGMAARSVIGDEMLARLGMGPDARRAEQGKRKSRDDDEGGSRPAKVIKIKEEPMDEGEDTPLSLPNPSVRRPANSSNQVKTGEGSNTRHQLPPKPPAGRSLNPSKQVQTGERSNALRQPPTHQVRRPANPSSQTQTGEGSNTQYKSSIGKPRRVLNPAKSSRKIKQEAGADTLATGSIARPEAVAEAANAQQDLPNVHPSRRPSISSGTSIKIKQEPGLEPLATGRGIEPPNTRRDVKPPTTGRPTRPAVAQNKKKKPNNGQTRRRGNRRGRGTGRREITDAAARERADNFGLTRDELNTVVSYGFKPWDDDTHVVLGDIS